MHCLSDRLGRIPICSARRQGSAQLGNNESFRILSKSCLAFQFLRQLQRQPPSSGAFPLLPVDDQ